MYTLNGESSLAFIAKYIYRYVCSGEIIGINLSYVLSSRGVGQLDIVKVFWTIILMFPPETIEIANKNQILLVENFIQKYREFLLYHFYVFL